MNPEEIFRNVTVGVRVYDINRHELLLIWKEHIFFLQQNPPTNAMADPKCQLGYSFLSTYNSQTQ